MINWYDNIPTHVDACKSCNEEQEPYNVWTTMLGIAVNFAILKWGGFF